MIARLSGLLIAKGTQEIVLDCQGVGYACAMSSRSLAELGSIGSVCTIWVQTLIQQEQLRLYGFLQREEQDWFLLLCSAPGVGPKLALAILSHFLPDTLRQAIGQRQIPQLTQVAGLGRKKAEQLCLALQDKLPPLAVLPTSKAVALDLQAALLALGFTSHLAGSLTEQAMQEQPDQTDIGMLLRSALSKTRPNVSVG